MHRREFIQGAGATALAPAWALGPFGADGDPGDDLEHDADGIPIPPEHIHSIRDDRGELEAYQPKLYYGHLLSSEQDAARSALRGLFGWTCESDEYDVTAHYYWMRSTTQRSALWYLGLDWGPDEHFLDHEPIIVFSNPDGTVDKVVCSGGHHYALEIDGEWGNLSEDRIPDRNTHVNLAVQRPHNHFVEALGDSEGVWIQGISGADFGSWLDERRAWYQNGRYSSTSKMAIEDPFTFYPSDGRTYWWREDTLDAAFGRWIAIPLGLSGETDTLRYEED